MAVPQAGVNVVFVGRTEEKGKAIEEELNALGKGEATFMKCDVTDFDALAACVNAAYEKYGKLNVVFNCAGIFPPQRPIDQWTLEEYDQVINTNLKSYIVVIRTALPYLRKSKGVIINVGSVLGKMGDEGAVPYTCTKGAIECMTKSLAIDEARHGVRAVEVKPGHINTEMFFKTTSEQADPDGIAYTVLFLASDWASFITGTDVMVSGGFDIGEGPKPINPFMASNKDANGENLYQNQRPMEDWINSL